MEIVSFSEKSLLTLECLSKLIPISLNTSQKWLPSTTHMTLTPQNCYSKPLHPFYATKPIL